MSQEFLTQQGFEDLEKRLENLKSVQRREVAEKIKIAREFGDISENSEYDAAKEEQAMIEGQILEIEQKLATAVIINEGDISTSIVSVGCTVTILDIEFDEKLVYKIVGTTEADTNNGRISNESPVGKALLGKKKNDTVLVRAPKGDLQFKILKIEN